jgi:nitrate reductase alpha subunit
VAPVPGKNAPTWRWWSATTRTSTSSSSLGPLLDKLGNGGKGINWNTEKKSSSSANSTITKTSGDQPGRPRIDTAIDAAEVILSLAPETNGQVAVKAWDALSEFTGIDHSHLALSKDERSASATSRRSRARSSPARPGRAWKTNTSATTPATPTCTKLIPWRTLTGRQQFYQDHPWMQAFGEQLMSYRPPVNTRPSRA